MFKNKSILITGGTGSFGKGLVKYLIKNYTGFKKIIIFSRDELKQFEMATTYSEEKYPFIRYFIGDVRDLDRLKRALEEVDYVIHAAALKQVEAAEYNPFEAIKTNVIGAQNIIEGCLSNKVKKVIALSTDKACAPINLYGATKLCSDKLFIAANNYAGKETKFSIVRYGNVLGSRGSVLPLVLKAKKNNTKFFLTDKKMTRFSIKLQEGVKVVDWASINLLGGEILVPKIPSYNLETLLKAAAPKNKFKISGLRKGEKMHEEMIATGDSYTTYDIGKYFLILPDNMSERCNLYKKKFKKFKKVEENFSYNSKNNKQFLNIEEIKKMIKNY